MSQILVGLPVARLRHTLKQETKYVIRHPVPDLFKLHLLLEKDSLKSVSLTALRSLYDHGHPKPVTFEVSGASELRSAFDTLLIDGFYQVASDRWGPVLELHPATPDEILASVELRLAKRHALIYRLFEGEQVKDELKASNMPHVLRFYSATLTSPEGHDALKKWLGLRSSRKGREA